MRARRSLWLDPCPRRTEVNAVRPLPKTNDAWLREIVAAYADAREAVPFGPLVGAEMRDSDLFQLAPMVCLKLRGIRRSKKALKQATEAALSSYVANQDREPEAFAKPHLAFAFCYLAAHYGLDLVRADELEAIMNYVMAKDALFVRMLKKTFG